MDYTVRLLMQTPSFKKEDCIKELKAVIARTKGYEQYNAKEALRVLLIKTHSEEMAQLLGVKQEDLERVLIAPNTTYVTDLKTKGNFNKDAFNELKTGVNKYPEELQESIMTMTSESPEDYLLAQDAEKLGIGQNNASVLKNAIKEPEKTGNLEALRALPNFDKEKFTMFAKERLLYPLAYEENKIIYLLSYLEST